MSNTVNIDAHYDRGTLYLKSRTFEIPVNMVDLQNKDGEKYFMRKQRKGATITLDGKKGAVIRDANFSFLEKKTLFIDLADKTKITLKGDFSKLIELFNKPAAECAGWKAHLSNIQIEVPTNESVKIIGINKIIEKVLFESPSSTKDISRLVNNITSNDLKLAGKALFDIWMELAKIEKDPALKGMAMATKDMRSYVQEQMNILSKMKQELSDEFSEFINTVIDVQEQNKK